MAKRNSKICLEVEKLISGSDDVTGRVAKIWSKKIKIFFFFIFSLFEKIFQTIYHISLTPPSAYATDWTNSFLKKLFKHWRLNDDICRQFHDNYSHIITYSRKMLSWELIVNTVLSTWWYSREGNYRR